MSSPVTVEKQHITIGVAVTAAFTLILLAFTAGKSTGSSSASVEIGFSQLNAQMAEIKKGLQDSETERRQTNDHFTQAIVEVTNKLSALQSRVDDLSVQVQQSSHTR